ncbi:hypothetical protein OG948_52770 (plasmid) [Embleya sp. NBC_00888]|uniref:hypothetical protein n=1 Tax=Embleya sp. NBC_00888 TaxID=2975960 RepID=UPI002F910CE2|nr:hypothetical protein OG948_52770 [Embleya sp. NBC_00888]
MPSIETLIPGAGRADVEGLREFDAGERARYVADWEHPWWRRRACAVALAGRVSKRWVAALSERVRDPGDTGAVRIALLEVLGDRAELLPWLRHEDRRDEGSYGDARHPPFGLLAALTTWPDPPGSAGQGLGGALSDQGVEADGSSGAEALIRVWSSVGGGLVDHAPAGGVAAWSRAPTNHGRPGSLGARRPFGHRVRVATESVCQDVPGRSGADDHVIGRGHSPL